MSLPVKRGCALYRGSVSSATSTSPGIDQLLDDRYRLEEPIARGGMATVFRGHDLRLDRTVALKIMHPHLATDADFRRRFGREARSAARLAHRNVVGVFDQGEDGDRIYLAMELVDGETLRSRITRQGRLTVRETLDLTSQVLQALVAAHSAGIVHHDIKPENILIDTDETAKVADFGLARVIGTTNSSASATLLGTVAYISPEVVTRGHSDERSDLYSLGVVLFEMLTGRQPFIGEQPVHIAFQHVHEDIPAPSSLVRGVPRELDSLVTWAAARTVGQRPATAEEILRVVRDLADSLPAAVLDARPELLEAADTGEVPRLTAPLGEVIAELDGAARTFRLHPEGTESPESSPGSESAPAEGADDSEGSTAEGSAADGSSSDAAAASSDDEGEEGLAGQHSSRSVILRSPRSRRGRHLLRGTRLRSRAVAALAGFSLIAVLGTGAWGSVHWYTETGPGADRSVPVLAGTQLTDAESALTAADLTIRTTEQFDATVPAGHVISSSIPAGETVKKGTAVSVVVSKGEQLFPVPEVTGLSLEDATAAVEAANLTLVEDDPQYSETVPQGEVISQSADQESLPAGGEVHVVLSQGRQPISIPNVAGDGEGGARSTLQAAGFEVTTSSAHSASVPAGSVISQSPASGSGYRGDTVSLVISLGPEMVQVPDVFQLPEAEAKAQLEAAGFAVTVEYQQGAPVFGLVYEQSAAAGTELAKGSTVTLTVF